MYFPCRGLTESSHNIPVPTPSISADGVGGELDGN